MSKLSYKRTHSTYHQHCQDDCLHDPFDSDPQSGTKSKSEVQMFKGREAILVETIQKLLNQKNVRSKVDDENGLNPNLLVNLLLIDDVMQIIQNLKNEYQNFIIKQIEQTLYRKSDKISGDIVEDTKILMQFYNEKNLKLKKLVGRMKNQNNTLANVLGDVEDFKIKGRLKQMDEEIFVKNKMNVTKKTVQKYANEILEE